MCSGANYRFLDLFGLASAEMSIRSTVGIVFWIFLSHLLIMASVGSPLDSVDQPVAYENETDCLPDVFSLALVLFGSISDFASCSFGALVT